MLSKFLVPALDFSSPCLVNNSPKYFPIINFVNLGQWIHRPHIDTVKT